MDSNKKKILAEATTFGIATCGDGATVHRMPLMNILCLSGEQPPVVLGIEDCTAHMQMVAQRMHHMLPIFFGVRLRKSILMGLIVDLCLFQWSKKCSKGG